jgi:hypothetical protein
MTKIEKKMGDRKVKREKQKNRRRELLRFTSH